MNLHILDTSNYIYAGAFTNRYVARGVRETNGTYGANEAPIGGVKFLIDSISNILKSDPDCVIMPVYDRTPEIKRGMYYDTYGDQYGYKGNRPKKSIDIDRQKNYSESILRDAGFIVQAVDMYEADDVIYSLVKYYKDDFDHIYVHTKDSDLFFLVSDNVSISQVSKSDKSIDIYNYSTMVNSKENTLYNTVHLRKLCGGDKSDNIPGVGWKWAEKLDEIIDGPEYAKLGDLDLCRKYLKEAIIKNPTVPGAHNLLNTFNILCPLLVPYEQLDDTEQDIDFNKFSYYRNNWDKSLDRWNLEDMLSDYIDSYYE